MNQKVFISSTFKDLKHYRLLVQNGLRQLGVQDISMENFGARDERPIEECIRLIKEDSDFFVGIYAHRYGFIPEGNKKSITQLEYLAALKAGVPKLLYIIDDEYPWPPKLIEDGDSKIKLQKFKEYLFSKHICKTFTNADNLVASVVADIGRTISIKKSSNLVVKSLPLKHIGMVSNPSPHDESIPYWNEERARIYSDCRGIFITHIIKPSKRNGQIFDVFIYLLRHQSEDFSDVKYAEFFLGPYWQNRVFKASEEKKGFIGISTSAYGTFLCTCKVTFKDNTKIKIHRYIDFEAERMNEFGT